MRRWWWVALLFLPSDLSGQGVARYLVGVKDSSAPVLRAMAGIQYGSGVINSAQTANYPETLVLVGRMSQLRDSLYLPSDTIRFAVTGPWKRWLVWAEYDAMVRIVPDSAEDVGQPSGVNTWGVEAVGAPAAWAMGATGEGVIVTSLDSGIDPTHPGYVVAGGYNAVTRTPTGWEDNIPGCNGHGTHVGGTMADRTGKGVAKGSRLFGVKVFEPIPCGSYTSAQIAGINWAVANGSRCVNISISGGESYSVNQAVIAARQAGTLVFRANGNSNTTPPQGTAQELQTASVNGSLSRSGFSNYGPQPQTDLAAPGEGVESTMPGGGYGTKSGTSMAAPHAAGSCALLLSAHPELTADSAAILLTRSAQPLGAQPNDYTGWGLVRPDRAIAMARGGVWVAGPTTDTRTGYQEVCYPMVATKAYTVGVTAGVQWRRDGDRVCLTLGPDTPRSIQVTVTAEPAVPVGPVVAIAPQTRYQTMSGWEATAQAGHESPGFLAWQGAVMDSAVAAGVNRLRVEVISGAENTTDAYALYRAGTITNTQYKAVRYAWTNDNADPTVINPAGFHFSKLDSQMVNVVIPLRDRLAARGEALYLSLNYVSFGASTAQADPNEYAELILATFQHLQARYGFVPDAVEMILEPDNNTIWTGTAIGRALAAAGPRLAAAGFRPDFIAPSTMSMAQAVPYLDAIVAVPGALPYLKEVSYHRYAGVSDAALAGIATRAQALGLRTAMLEHIGSGVDALLADVTTGRASAWQQYTLAFPTTDDGAQYFPIVSGQVTTGSRTKLLAPIFRAVKRGAVRVGSSSPDFVTAAFLNPNGRVVVVVRTRGPGSFTLTGLPAGSYQATFTAESGTMVTTPVSGVVTVPGAGVVVVQ